MKRSQSLLLFCITLFILPAVAHAQAWAGIISPSRATDWTQAGSGGLPDASWTQCGPTIGPYTGPATTITRALGFCGANHFVQLGAGTFNINSGQITFPTSGHVALRGMGANSTFMVFSGTAGQVVCGQAQAIICARSSDGSYSTGNPITYDWTAGYAQGSNQITLSSVAKIMPNSTLLVLDQCEDGYTGSPCAGSAVDNGQMFVCQDIYVVATTHGCSTNGPDRATKDHRGQEQIVLATAVNGNVVTISSPIVAPNWRAAQNPQVWIVQSISQVGVENMAIDGTNASTPTGVEFASAHHWWLSGLKFVGVNVWCMNAFQTTYGIVQDSYLYKTRGVDSYGLRLSNSSFALIQNNIFEQMIAPIVFDGADTGSVVAYNFDINNTYGSDWMKFFSDLHDVNEFQLYEGNIANGIQEDGSHGTTDMFTKFRNFLTGWESCGNGQCGTAPNKDSSTAADPSHVFDRYDNLVGNVLGTPGFQNSYQNVNDHSIYSAGRLDGSIPIPADPLVLLTRLRWANYDTVTAATRFCGNPSNTGWLTTCLSVPEVPLAISPYPNSLPTLGDTGAGQGPLPASFYLAGKPAWFGSIPWPPIGPDVSNGNVGQCGDGTKIPIPNTPLRGVAALTAAQCGGIGLFAPAWAGHVNANPAMNCALNVMGMPPDGTGSALPFDAKTCYGSNTPPSGPPTKPLAVPN